MMGLDISFDRKEAEEAWKMTNAKEEFLNEIGRDILCAKVSYCPDYETTKVFILRVGHTEADMNTFLNGLDFKYDSGYGTQHVFGNVWINNEAWAYRDEYDGSEWWTIQSYPEIPEELK